MPIPPQVAVAVANEASKTNLGKQVLGAVGSVIAGVGVGIAGMGKILGSDIAVADAKAAAQGQILVAVANQYQQQVDALRLQIAQQSLELALCEEGNDE